MSSYFEKLRIVSKYELLKQVRRRRFYGALIITIFVQILTIALYKGLDIPGELGIPDNPEIFAIFITSMGTIAIIGAVFFAGDAIASEFEHKTGYILFINPVKRTTLVIGKYIACFIATAAILVMAYLLSAAALLGFYQQIPVGIIGSLGIALMLACSVLSMAFIYSSLLKGGMGATIATLLTFILISPIISLGLSYAGYEPWFMPDYAADAVASTYSVSLQQAFGPIIGGLQMPRMLMRPEAIKSFLVLLGYTVALFPLSIWIANRREMF